MSVQLPQFTVETEFRLKSQLTKTSQHLYSKGICSHAFKRAWENGLTGKDVIVAIADTGIDGNHPDLQGKVIQSFNLTNEPLRQNHGTHVAGTIAANGWLVGGAPDASLIDIKILGEEGGTIDNVINAISIAVSHGATIINLSLGSSYLPQNEMDNLTNAIQNAWNHGVICIAAAGNDGTSICTPDPYYYPASIEKVESVAACDVGENLNTITLASFSNENNMVDLAACGKNVISTVIGGEYGVFSGTSMATPHVSAMAAILTQYIKNKYPTLKDSSFSAALVSLIHSNILKIDAPPGCGIASAVMVKNKILVVHSTATKCSKTKDNQKQNAVLQQESSNISFGLGFLRYEPNDGPVTPNGEKYYYNNIFLGYEVSD